MSFSHSHLSRSFSFDRSMAHQQWQGSRSYYAAWSNQYNNQQQPYQYNYAQQDQYDPSYPYYYPPQQQQQYPYTTANSQQPPHSSVIDQLHEQTQQQQALGALAAASITTALQGGQNNSTMWYSHQQQQPPQAYTQQHHHYPSQRPIVAYNDLESSPAPPPPRPQGSFCCNRWYRTLAAKEQHERNHIQCAMCSFSGIKAVMDEHMEIQHGQTPPEGSSKKKNKPDGIVPPNAPKINTPEELAAWIEARKRNWPTKANVERKQREEAERVVRGQLPKDNDKKRKRKDGGNVDSNKVPKMESMNVLGAYGSDDDDDDDDNNESDSDASVDMERDAVTAKDPTSMGKIALPNEHKARGPRCRFFARGHCRHGNKCRYVHEKPTQQNTKRTQVTPIEEKRPTLLRMLLAKEIKEEQNVILQCFRHIVDNQFFGRS
ncbi:hypothetical protein K492DRAFT_235075 [Lichtheimia hyalospora FSU 10163]|nr:hypothetical protein K492DRAFT_235075 [Lichtheimia hyalospora FSU 10163]